MDLTQGDVLSFLLEHGGKVKNSELVNRFRSQISCGDPAEKQRVRELFKKLVNSVAVVRQADEAKFVVVRKKYRHLTPKEIFDDGQNVTFPATAPSSGSSVCQRGCYVSDNHRAAGTTAVKILNVSSDQTGRTGKSGAVFAVIAVKSPPQLPHGQPQHIEEPIAAGLKASRVPILDHCFPKCEKNKRQGDGAKLCDSVPLEPLAHQWLVKCAAGLWEQIDALLLQDRELAQRKDFISGFTALHWAAKDGNCDVVHKLMDACRKSCTCVNVNSRSHGGYTPLHIAAMHGQTEVMAVLVRQYGASVSERDNGGKKAYHYLGKSASVEVRALLGDLQQHKCEKTEGREQPKGFTTISKLFQPHLGKKQRPASKFAQDW